MKKASTPLRQNLQCGPIFAEVWRKPIRNLYVRVLPPDGRVSVSAPTSMPDETICAFLLQKQRWIKSKQREVRARTAALSDRTHATLWGEPLPLICENPTAKPGAALQSGKIALYGPHPFDHLPLLLKPIYRSELLRVLPDIVERYSVVVGKHPARWSVRDMSTRWGSCTPQAGSIRFSLRLAQYPPRCLEYVVAHELTHLIVPGHGPVFWQHMDRFFPDWRSVRARLRYPPQIEPRP